MIQKICKVFFIGVSVSEIRVLQKYLQIWFLFYNFPYSIKLVNALFCKWASKTNEHISIFCGAELGLSKFNGTKTFWG